MRCTQYFLASRQRLDRAIIREDWIRLAIEEPIREVIQQDGRIRRWAKIADRDGRYLRVVLLADGQTVQNAFFGRSFKP